jgi:hypothetical protein
MNDFESRKKAAARMRNDQAYITRVTEIVSAVIMGYCRGRGPEFKLDRPQEEYIYDEAGNVTNIADLEEISGLLQKALRNVMGVGHLAAFDYTLPHDPSGVKIEVFGDDDDSFSFRVDEEGKIYDLELP